MASVLVATDWAAVRAFLPDELFTLLSVDNKRIAGRRGRLSWRRPRRRRRRQRRPPTDYHQYDDDYSAFSTSSSSDSSLSTTPPKSSIVALTTNGSLFFAPAAASTTSCAGAAATYIPGVSHPSSIGAAESMMMNLGGIGGGIIGGGGGGGGGDSVSAASSSAVVINPYHILQVRKDATPSEIREAYRRLALLHHPGRKRSRGAKSPQCPSPPPLADYVSDVGGDINSNLIFTAISASYEVLLDNDARQRFDFLWMQRQRQLAGTPESKGEGLTGGKRMIQAPPPPPSASPSYDILSLHTRERSSFYGGTGGGAAGTVFQSLMPQHEQPDQHLGQSGCFSCSQASMCHDNLASDPLRDEDFHNGPATDADKNQHYFPNVMDVGLVATSSSDDGSSSRGSLAATSATTNTEALPPGAEKAGGVGTKRRFEYDPHLLLSPQGPANDSNNAPPPLSLLHKARRNEPFTDPYKVFDQVFGSHIFKQWQPPPPPKTTKNDGESVSMASSNRKSPHREDAAGIRPPPPAEGGQNNKFALAKFTPSWKTFLGIGTKVVGGADNKSDGGKASYHKTATILTAASSWTSFSGGHNSRSSKRQQQQQQLELMRRTPHHWSTRTSRNSDGSVVHTTSRIVNDRKLTRTEVVTEDSKTGQRHTSVSVVAEDLTDYDDDDVYQDFFGHNDNSDHDDDTRSHASTFFDEDDDDSILWRPSSSSSSKANPAAISPPLPSRCFACHSSPYHCAVRNKNEDNFNNDENYGDDHGKHTCCAKDKPGNGHADDDGNDEVDQYSVEKEFDDDNDGHGGAVSCGGCGSLRMLKHTSARYNNAHGDDDNSIEAPSLASRSSSFRRRKSRRTGMGAIVTSISPTTASMPRQPDEYSTTSNDDNNANNPTTACEDSLFFCCYFLFP